MRLGAHPNPRSGHAPGDRAGYGRVDDCWAEDGAVDHGWAAREKLEHDRYDRQVRAFGAQAQDRLRRLTVAVAGAGGAGSLVVQGLAHLGVGRLLVVDPDILDTTNLNRVVGATPADAADGTPKVDVAARLARAVDPSLPVAAVRGSVLDPTVWRVLRCADILVGAVDGHAPRWALNVLAVQYGRFYVDVGVEIGVGTGLPAGTPTGLQAATDGEPRIGFRNSGGEPEVGGLEVGGHVAVVRPGGPCLLCQCGYDPALAAAELDPVTRAVKRSAGYLPSGLDEPAPSVLFLNQAVVAHALGEILNIAWPWRRPVAQLFVDLARPATLDLEAMPDPSCPACGPGSVRGLADAGGIPPVASRRHLPATRPWAPPRQPSSAVPRPSRHPPRPSMTKPVSVDARHGAREH